MGLKGKTVTLIQGLSMTPDELKDFARQLKKKTGTGGALKNGIIEIQGVHRERISGILEILGRQVKRVSWILKMRRYRIWTINSTGVIKVSLDEAFRKIPVVSDHGNHLRVNGAHDSDFGNMAVVLFVLNNI